MNSLKEFENHLKIISDNELYETAKSNLELFAFTDYKNQKKLSLIYSECERRGRNIYKKALNDAYLSSVSSFGNISESRLLNIQRLDFMSESEIQQLVSIISKSINIKGKIISFASDLNIYKLLGIPEEDLLLFKVSGDSMIEEGINDGDLVVADRRVQIVNKKLVIVEYKGELFIKRLLLEEGILWLKSANEKIRPFKLNGREEIKIIAIVKNLIKNLQ